MPRIAFLRRNCYGMKIQMQIHMSLRNCHLLSCCNNLHIAVTPEEDYKQSKRTVINILNSGVVNNSFVTSIIGNTVSLFSCDICIYILFDMIAQMKKTENIEPNIKIKSTFRHKSCLFQDNQFAFAQTKYVYINIYTIRFLQ